MFAVLLYATAAGAAVEGPGRNQFIQATPVTERIQVDGQLNEPAWAEAPVFDAFVQRFPNAGAAPSERTEVRILYDSDHVYFGVIARDSQPALIDQRLARRDTFPTTDSVQLIIDSTHDHRTAYSFYLSAGGVHGDGLFFDDRNFTTDWDAVWDGATRTVNDGWVAEFAIPLSVLRFPEAPMQTWGFSVRREIARLNEEIESVDNPRTSNANVSRLGHLTGMEGLRPQRSLEMVPYLATRSLLRPQFSDVTRPEPRRLDPTLDLGLDLKAALTSNLALNATLNPDFGQVEADQLTLNLTTFETFFPEKRPFFTQGLELFQPVGSELGQPAQSLFYSRRIGLETPIFGAAKLTGTASKGVEVGVLDALVTSPWQAQDDEVPDRRWRLHASRPLHLGTNDSLPSSPQAPTNFLAAVVRGSVGENSRIGASVASAIPVVGECTIEKAALGKQRPAECLAQGGMGVAADFDLKTADSAYGLLGQVSASRVVGGLPERPLRDGTLLHPGDGGYGGYVRAGKFGGEGFRWDLGYDFSTPTLELNATGYQRTQNEQAPRVELRYQRPNGFGPLRDFSVNLIGSTAWTTDGRLINRGSRVTLDVTAQLPSSDTLGMQMGMNVGGYDVRELAGTGIPLQKEFSDFLLLNWKTNSNRVAQLQGYLAAAYHDRGPAPGAWAWGADLILTLRPHPALETRFEILDDRTEYGPRFVANQGNNLFLLGNLQSNYLSMTVRQQWVLRPNLTLQGYAQLFTDYGIYGPFFEATSDEERTAIRFAALRPTEGQADDFYDTALNLSLVLRWEYRLGSTFFFVYTRSQQGLKVFDDERMPTTLLPRNLGSGPATDAVMLKWSYYWAV
ncbi:hypothetical protein DRW03_03470 [Corallococcus sp. H22C18031201]|nr:hypothetical protein DRW03_03470 [Corallococcus sp. H22C18031201]